MFIQLKLLLVLIEGHAFIVNPGIAHVPLAEDHKALPSLLQKRLHLLFLSQCPLYMHSRCRD